MSEFNLTFEGNLAAKPELDVTAGGQVLCRLRVAHNRGYRNTEGDWVETAPMWVAVTAWGRLAERCAELNKGDTVVVRTRDDLDVWAFIRQDGTAGGVLQVTAENVSVSMRFTAALPTPDPRTGDSWDPAADPDAATERHLQAVA